MIKLQNQNEYGIVATSCYLTLEYVVEKHQRGENVRAEVRKEAKMDFDPKYHKDDRLYLFSQIAGFQKTGNSILRQAKKLLEAGQYIRITLATSQREHVEEYTDYSIPGYPLQSTLRPLMYNEWEYHGDGTEGELDPDEGGLYFRPDARYTDECRDFYLPWGKDILKLLAEDANI